MSKFKRLLAPAPPVAALYRTLPPRGSVLDLGCAGFTQFALAREMGRPDLRHSGVDCFDRRADAPPGFDFRLADLDAGKLPFPDDTFDLVVASHVLEHLDNAIRVVGEALRCSKPGGLVYIAVPSERSLLAPGMFFDFDKSCSLSFYDDPTHRGRPFTPQSLYRMAADFGCQPLRAGYRVSWACRLLFPALAAYTLLTKKAVAFQRLWWLVTGWEAYCLIAKGCHDGGAPAFEYFRKRGSRNSLNRN